MSGNRRYGKAMLSIATALALAGGMSSGLDLKKPQEEDPELREFLSLYRGNALEMWQRRVRRGLTAEEREFVKKKLQEKQNETK